MDDGQLITMSRYLIVLYCTGHTYTPCISTVLAQVSQVGRNITKGYMTLLVIYLNHISLRQEYHSMMHWSRLNLIYTIPNFSSYSGNVH